MQKNKRKIIVILGIIILFIVLIYLKPVSNGRNYQSNFSSWNKEIKIKQAGACAAILDLDAIDHNIDLVKKRLVPRYSIRLVIKSLPSLELIDYILKKIQTNKLMVFSEPFLREILLKYPEQPIDILLGKPLPVEAANRIYPLKNSGSINWLVDTGERLNQFLTLAKQKKIKLKINFEIDVGLHRGGFKKREELSDVLQVVKNNPKNLVFTGLMGYDGHVPHAPPIFTTKERAVSNAFEKVQKNYADFVSEINSTNKKMLNHDITFNGGGSHTYLFYPEYKDKTPINDIAIGSVFLTPESFSDLIPQGHQPAIFLASPVLKKMPTELPFAEWLSNLISMWDPNSRVSYFLLAGGWAGEPVSPPGLQRNGFWDSGEGIKNLLPNQSLLNGSVETGLNVGDYVFYHAWEGDGMISLKKVLVMRNNKISAEWDTYHEAN